MKILLCSEFTYISSGYAKYYKELAEAFINDGHEVIELAAVGQNGLWSHENYKRSCPWKIYLNEPNPSDKESVKMYQKDQSSFHGSWIYNDILLEEKPDVVIGLRDFWYDEFILESPLSKYTTVILSPTVDSIPQHEQWIDGLGRADIVTFYNEWSENWYRVQASNHNVVNYISPSAGENFGNTNNKKILRERFGLPVDAKIAGTVMRNNPRKKIPELFEVFAELKDKYLYCHTTYPDKHWQIPTLLIQYGVSDRVFFTYKCERCSDITASLWRGSTDVCSKCSGRIMLPSTLNGITENELNDIYNTFDIYIQWHDSEGFGIPAIEASKAGCRVFTTNYSAQTDVIEKIKGTGVDPAGYIRNNVNSCLKAIPDNKKLIEILNNDNEWIRPEKSEDVYTKEITSEKWLNLVNSIIPKNNWNTRVQFNKPIPFDDIKHLSNELFIVACVKYIAQDLNYLGDFATADLLNSLNDGFVQIDVGKTTSKIDFGKRQVYDHFHTKYVEKIKWEQRRMSQQ